MVGDLYYHSTEWEPTGKVTVDDMFYHSTEWEPTGEVTVNDFFTILQNENPVV